MSPSTATAGRQTLADRLDRLTREAEVYRTLQDGSVQCLACGHRCLIREGKRGICQVRFNQGGRLYAPWGYVCGLNVDPIEKKPFFHVLPGTRTLTFGMLGCDLHCSYCQNWITSQALRDPAAGAPVDLISPEEMVNIALDYRSPFITSSYNEPLITAEWAVAIFKQAQAYGIRGLFVSNGNLTPEVLEYLRPYLAGYKIDLKSMNDRSYRQLGTTLSNVLDGIRMVHESGLWLEVVTLVVPGFNDSDEELREAARFLVSLSPDIPWHVTAFHRDYKMLDHNDTDVRTLLRAAEIGRSEGLRYVYAGNIPGMVGDWENTYCPQCNALLIKRWGFRVLEDHLSGSGRCYRCGTSIPGVWQ
ncbi:MAG: AmmeMemoRadiSam system radical SAM enzyme [Chthonomonadetes bacterium]|nr:AmmeMemoRadiSam system radical SAM enzyme [Chthonomonadetes bacterium]